jgi:hypothetical protein
LVSKFQRYVEINTVDNKDLRTSNEKLSLYLAKKSSGLMQIKIAYNENVKNKEIGIAPRMSMSEWLISFSIKTSHDFMPVNTKTASTIDSATISFSKTELAFFWSGSMKNILFVNASKLSYFK